MKMFKKLMLVSLAFAMQATQGTKLEANVVAPLHKELRSYEVPDLWRKRLEIIDRVYSFYPAPISHSAQYLTPDSNFPADEKERDLIVLYKEISDALERTPDALHPDVRNSLNEKYESHFVKHLSQEAQALMASLENNVDTMITLLPIARPEKEVCLELLQFDAARELAKIADPSERQLIKHASLWMKERLQKYINIIHKEVNYVNVRGDFLVDLFNYKDRGMFFTRVFSGDTFGSLRNYMDKQESINAREMITSIVDEKFGTPNPLNPAFMSDVSVGKLIKLSDAVYISLVAQFLIVELDKAIDIADDFEQGKQAMLDKVQVLGGRILKNMRLLPGIFEGLHDEVIRLSGLVSLTTNQSDLRALFPEITRVERDLALNESSFDEVAAIRRDSFATKIQKMMRGRWGRKQAQDKRDARLAAEQAARAEKEARKSAARSSLRKHAEQVGREGLRKAEVEKRAVAARDLVAKQNAAKELREAEAAERVAKQKRREAAQAAAAAQKAERKAGKERAEAQAAQRRLAKK